MTATDGSAGGGTSPTSPLRTVLAVADRGTVPFELLHGRPLYVHALRALGEAFPVQVTVSVDQSNVDRVRTDVAALGVSARIVPGSTWWEEPTEATMSDLLVHDALCPLTSSDFLRDVRERAFARPGCSFASFRPVTDTVKTVVEGRISGTVDRARLAAVTSPVLVAGSALTRAVAARSAPPLRDFAELLTWLRRFGDTELVTAPALARRVDDASAVTLLEALDEVAGRTG